MVKRAMVYLFAAMMALLAAGCAASAKPTVEELRKQYPLYDPGPLWDGAWATVQGIVSAADSGVLATITDHEIMHLKNESNGGKAIPSMQALSKDYERYTLRIDTVIFGQNPGGEVALYVPVVAMQPQQDVDQSEGQRFFYNLARLPQEQQQLVTLLACNGFQERLPIRMGGAMFYWTKEGYMLSARPLVGADNYNLMTKAEFIRAITSIPNSTTPLPTTTP